MKLVHLSDLHLGHRVFPRVERGGNLRERDLAGAFHLAVHEIGRLAPDLVLLAGDLFDQSDPPSSAFLALTRGIRRLQELLPGVPVLAVAGAADTPLSAGDPGPVAVLDAVPGVEAAAGAPRSVRVSRLGLHALLVPHRAVVRPPYPELRPDPDARWNVLLVRGYPEGGGGVGPGAGEGAAALPLDLEGWDYVAVGGPHQARSWAPGVRASGSLERVGVDPWAEAGEEKGFLFVDLEARRSTFHPIRTRPVVDLAPVRVDPEDVEAGTRRLRELLESYPGGVDGKLLRVRIRGPVLAPTEGISAALLSGIRRRAAHLEIQVEGGEEEPPVAGASGDPPKRDPSLFPTLGWSTGGGRGGEAVLSPGLWAVTAPLPEDLDRLVEGLSRVGRERTEEPDSSRLSFTLRPTGEGSVTRRERGQAGPTPSPAPSPSRGSTGAGPGPAGSGEGELLSDAELHAEWIEVEGDAEARALDWARERQEADSRLLAYRERAREIRDRIQALRAEGPEARCPTCRRPLAEAHPGLLEFLEEEWEEVVQDGSWWKRRRAQLDDKPPDLLVLERRALGLRARLEEGPAMPERTAGPEPAFPPLSRSLLRRAGAHLQRATAGMLTAAIQGGGGEAGAIEVVEGSGLRRPVSSAEAELVALALQVAEAELQVPGGGGGAHVLLAGGGVPAPVLSRFLEGLVLPGTPGVAATWVAVVPFEVAQGLHAHLAGSLELTRDPDGRPRIRMGAPGRARLLPPPAGAPSRGR